MAIEAALERIYEELTTLKLIQQETAHTVRGVLEEARRTNGRVGVLEVKEVARREQEAEARGRSEALITWTAVTKIGTAAGGASAVIGLVGWLLVRMSA